MQHDDPVRQSNRFAHGVGDEENSLVRLAPKVLNAMVQFSSCLGVEGSERLIH